MFYWWSDKFINDFIDSMGISQVVFIGVVVAEYGGGGGGGGGCGHGGSGGASGCGGGGGGAPEFVGGAGGGNLPHNHTYVNMYIKVNLQQAEEWNSVILWWRR